MTKKNDREKEVKELLNLIMQNLGNFGILMHPSTSFDLKDVFQVLVSMGLAEEKEFRFLDRSIESKQIHSYEDKTKYWITTLADYFPSGPNSMTINPCDLHALMNKLTVYGLISKEDRDLVKYTVESNQKSLNINC